MASSLTKKYFKIIGITIIFLLISFMVWSISVNASGLINGDFENGLTGWVNWHDTTGGIYEAYTPGYNNTYSLHLYTSSWQNVNERQFVIATGGNVTLDYKYYAATSGNGMTFIGIYKTVDNTLLAGNTYYSTGGVYLPGSITVLDVPAGTNLTIFVQSYTTYSGGAGIFVDEMILTQNQPEYYKLKLTMVDADTGSLITNGYVNLSLSDGTYSTSYITQPNTEFSIMKPKTVIATYSAPGYVDQVIGYTDNITATINMRSNTIAGMVKAKFTSNVQKFDIQMLDESDVLRYYHSDIGYIEVNINPNEYYNYYAKSEYYTTKYYSLSGVINTSTDININVNFYENTYQDVTATPDPNGNFEDTINAYPPPPSLPNNLFNPLEWLFYIAKLISWIAGFVWYVCVSFMRTLINYMSQLIDLNSEVVNPLFLNNTTKYDFYKGFWDSINNSTMQSVNTAFQPIIDIKNKEIEISDLVHDQEQAATNASTVYQVLFMPMLAGLPTSFKMYGVWKLTLLMLLQVMGK